MKRVLIICDLFPPAFAPRMGYLCKYLKKSGWEPTVITEDIEENIFDFLAYSCKIHRIKFYKDTDWISGKVKSFITLIKDHFFGYKDNRVYKEACKLIKDQPFDLVLCSTYRNFPLPAALKIAQHFNYPLIVDIRDIIEEYTGNEFIKMDLSTFWGIDKIIIPFLKKRMVNNRNKVLQKADHITTVSVWHKVFLQKYNPNTSLIYNGYDPEVFFPEDIQTDHFIITYTGRILSFDMRDPTLLFEAIQNLTREKKLSPEKCRICWYMDDISEQMIKSLAQQYKVTDYMDYMGYVDGKLIPKILNSSSVLLLLTNKADQNGPKGVMTTKFFEFIAVNKPVLCVRSDEDCLEEAIQETNAGLAARNVQEVEGFIQYYYQKWKTDKQTRVNIHKENLKKFSRKEQANQFIDIFESLSIKR